MTGIDTNFENTFTVTLTDTNTGDLIPFEKEVSCVIASNKDLVFKMMITPSKRVSFKLKVVPSSFNLFGGMVKSLTESIGDRNNFGQETITMTAQ
jgi:hypothetical protein